MIKRNLRYFSYLDGMRLFILLLLIVIDLPVNAQAITDSVRNNTTDTSTTIMPYQEKYQPDEEMDTFLALLAFVGISVMLGISVLTIIIGVLALLAITALIGAGILSASIGVGIYRKSFNAGVRTAVGLIITIICGAGGTVAAILFIKLFDSPASAGTAALIGSGAGIIGGIIASACLFWLIKKLLGSIRQ